MGKGADDVEWTDYRTKEDKKPDVLVSDDTVKSESPEVVSSGEVLMEDKVIKEASDG